MLSRSNKKYPLLNIKKYNTKMHTSMNSFDNKGFVKLHFHIQCIKDFHMYEYFIPETEVV